jgi:beta-alanine--pyruvate transaminase
MLEPSSDLNVEPYWLPFTPNRYFKRQPKIVVRAEGAYYEMADGKRLFDCLSGLWCCPLGHAHRGIADALARQVLELDYAPAFNIGHPKAFRLAERIAAMAPSGLTHVFFANSGSEAVDSALKIALAYHRYRGEATRTRFVGRERGYHGVGFGGMSVGGMPANRKMFSPLMLPGVDHLSDTRRGGRSFVRGQPQTGVELADELERIVALHDPSNIAAVIVEPVAGSAGVLVPPVGYLNRLREICTRYGILLIFDEVITGFGRLGTHFAAQRFGVTPDLITFAKAVTNGVVPMGGVIVRREIYDAFMTGGERAIELFHGYTYSGHPIAAAAGLAALDALVQPATLERVRLLEQVLENAVHSLVREGGVLDVRNIGLAAAVELEPDPGQPGLRAARVFDRGIAEGVLLRVTGDTVALAPPFISTDEEVRSMIEALRRAIRAAG